MTLAPGMRDPDSNADRRTRVSEQLRRRAQTARFLAASRRREFVTVRRFAPNSFLEAHITRFQQWWSRTETPSQDFPRAAAGGDVCHGLRGLDDFGQELLAEWG